MRSEENSVRRKTVTETDTEQCEPGLVFWLVEELLDSQTLDGCRIVFDYLDSRRERLTAVSETKPLCPVRIRSLTPVLSLETFPKERAYSTQVM